MQETGTRRHFELFDSLRGIAVLSVLAFHIGAASLANATAWYGVYTSQLLLGVTIFFLISGFLLYRPYAMAQFAGAQTPVTGIYARRRFLRIVPAYWAALTLLAVWPGLEGVFTGDWWVYYGLFQSYRPRFMTGGIGAAWSLSVEVAFYVCLPLLALALARLGPQLPVGRRVSLHVSLVLALGAVSLAFRVVAQFALPSVVWTLPALFLGFALGISLAMLSAWLEGRERQWAPARLVVDHPDVCWLLALGLFLAGGLTSAFQRTFGVEHTHASYLGQNLLHCAIAFLIVLPAVCGESAGGFSRRVLATRSLTWVGEISYGIFLWHLPLVKVLADYGAAALIPGAPFASLAIVALPVSLLCGFASYRLVELPVMRLR